MIHDTKRSERECAFQCLLLRANGSLRACTMLLSRSNVTIPPPPPGTNYLAVIRPSLAFILTSTVLASLLIPILISLLVFSTPQIRRHPVFVLNVLGVLLGLTEGVVNVYNAMHTILYPTVTESAAAIVAYGALAFYGSLVVESTLVIRLTVAYPRSTTSKAKFWSILSVPITLNVIRTINIAVFLGHLVTAIYGSKHSFAANAISLENWQIKLEWILQAVNNAFVSFMFLRRLPRTGACNGVVQSSKTLGRIILCTMLIPLLDAMVSRLRGLFLIALSNFVFPVILNIIQLGLIFSSTTSSIQASIVFVVNNYVNIIGVVFATVWSIGSRRLEASLPPTRSLFNEGSAIAAGRIRNAEDILNFKSVNLAESVELEANKPRTSIDKSAPTAQNNNANV
ncbi:hypothetical protein DEU56DRAFT_351954 [Suillus clintonianus]|uniref:uncharacterized protein n=1 Tax=Suillus clintonianus TaxID=1904413 RepID=UPI001B85C52D|nr:uncharacterized protein DEU56DRAFT_351954 [Suillus clintonianus]KAG2137526.1 hypothetical protein DEU56DRAFT_351954 [Suillus clintonianus]